MSTTSSVISGTRNDDRGSGARFGVETLSRLDGFRFSKRFNPQRQRQQDSYIFILYFGVDAPSRCDFHPVNSSIIGITRGKYRDALGRSPNFDHLDGSRIPAPLLVAREFRAEGAGLAPKRIPMRRYSGHPAWDRFFVLSTCVFVGSSLEDEYGVTEGLQVGDTSSANHTAIMPYKYIIRV